MSDKLTVMLKIKAPKKHSVRFDAEGDNPALRSAYIDNEALAHLGNPKEIRVTIEAA